ncbi:dihydroxyacetone kinase subunit L [Paenibacillus sp. LMG 31456]|uniref:phosphoenolpyruvate--glycerone phosphotransferase n=1 Tax=Paenibacillus foliorum TaxID=2654974 RepID=A0A972GMM9_9BACL|nr:dihydroxyacetone kinase subunit DhaL [Paenibacillus foliorum]NOU93514.1 dihydroxyacetone kinase subunit L [Paenibacillus foliorum]
MKELLHKSDIIQILEAISKIMDDSKDELCRLDGALGDGDIGLTMSKGFKAIVSNIPAIPDEDISGLFVKSALVMGDTVASTMGTLFSTALLRGGKALSGKTELSGEDLILFIEAMIKGISDRGKAQVGDKTILDALVPAAEAMVLANREQATLKEIISKGYEAAESGVAKTIAMQSKHGRAGRYLERSIGLQDPGATVGALFLKGFVNYLG